MTFLYLWGELRKESSVGFAARHAREFSPKGNVRWVARRYFCQPITEVGCLGETRSAERGGPPCIFGGERSSQEGPDLVILRLSERPKATDTEVPCERLALDENARRFAQCSA